MKRILTLLLLCLIIPLSMSAQSPTITWDATGKIGTVTNATPGSLYGLLLTGTKMTTCTSITISGTIDVRDFVTMRSYMTALTTINISNVTIASYEGYEGTEGSTFQADYIPLLGLSASRYTSVVLPGSIKGLEAYAFQNSTGLTSVTIPASVKSLGTGVFSGCTRLTSLTIPDGITELPSGMVSGCKNLTSITFPSTVSTIGSTCFSGTAITSLTIPEGVSTISSSLFLDCTLLQSVVLPSTLRTIEKNAFEGCSALPSVTLPSQLSSLSTDVFLGCTSLTNISIPANVRTITNSFADCPATVTLATGNPNFVQENGMIFFPDKSVLLYCSKSKTGALTIPSTVNYIAQGALDGCSGLTSVAVPTSVNRIHATAFRKCTGLSSLTLPSGLEYVDRTAFDSCPNLTVNYAVGGKFAIVDGVRFSADMKTLYEFPSARTGTYVVPEGVETIEQYAFMGSQLTEIVLPNSLRSIVTYAFYKANRIKTLIVPNNVSDIGASAFAYMSSLISVKLPNGLVRLQSTLFASCGKLVDIDIPESVTEIASQAFNGCSSITSLKLPDNLREFGDLALNNCAAISQITIPATVTTVGYGTFRGCSSLKTIYMKNPVPVNMTGEETVATFYAINPACTLIVPTGSLQAYQSAPVWKDAPSIVEESVAFGRDSISVTVATAGTLSAVLKAQNVLPETIGKLTLSGTLNAIDFKFLRDSVPFVQKLDFAATSIAAVTTTNGTYVPAGVSYAYPANQFPYYALYNKGSQLTEVIFPLTITSTAYGVLRNCQGITKVVIPTGVTALGQNSFYGCYGLKSVSLPSTLTTIGIQCFYNCRSLENIEIPSSIVTFGYSGFYNCFALKSIKMNKATVPTTGVTMFTGVDLAKAVLYVPAGAEAVYDAATQWTDFGTIVSPVSLTRSGITPGTVAGTLSVSEKAAVETLTISGQIDARDFVFLRDSLPSLKRLDLSATSVSAYTGAQGSGGNTTITYPANALPESAFAQNNMLDSVALPTGLTRIDKRAFWQCAALRSVVNPGSVSFIGDNAFTSCVKLATFAPHSVVNVGTGAFSYCKSLPSFDFSSVVLFGEGAFSECSALTSINLSSSVVRIPANTFKGCTAISPSVVFPASVTTVDDYAFGSCVGLTSVTLPASLTSLSNLAFAGCTNLSFGFDAAADFSMEDGVLFDKAKTRLIAYPATKEGAYSIPSSVTTIAPHAFMNSVGLTSLVIPNAVTVIPDSAFMGCIRLESVTLPNALTAIGHSSFARCLALPALSLPATVTAIDTAAFKGCVSLKSINLPAGITRISSELFNGCSSLSTIVLPASVTTIESGFDSGSANNKLELPASVSSLKSYAFMKAYSTLKVNNPVPVDLTNEPLVFWTLTKGITTVIVPSGSLAAYKAAPQWKEFVNLVEENTVLTINPVLPGFLDTQITPEQRISTTKLVLKGAMDARDFRTIRDYMYNVQEIDLSGVTAINAYTGVAGPASGNIAYPANELPEYALSITTANYSKIKAVTLPTCIDSIGKNAFYYCTVLESIGVPEGVKSIEQNAFNNCISLKTVTLPSTLTTIGDYAFRNCNELTAIVLPETLTTIGAHAFSYCRKLTSVTIPASVVSLGDYAFRSCSQLNTVRFNPSTATVGSYAFTDCTNLSKVYPAATTPVALPNPYVFYAVDKSACNLYVPAGSETLYQAADQWKDFLLVAPAPTTKQLTLKVLLEGLWNGTSMNKAKYVDVVSGDVVDKFSGVIADTLSVELHSATYSTIAYRISGLQIDQDGIVHTPGQTYVEVPGDATGSYYLTIRSRNHLETTTAAMLSFSGSTIDYDFTDSDSKAYVYPDATFTSQKQIDGKWMLYAGDVKPDDDFPQVSFLDFMHIYTNYTERTEIYDFLKEDLNGDGFVDFLDLMMCFRNVSEGVYFFKE